MRKEKEKHAFIAPFTHLPKLVFLTAQVQTNTTTTRTKHMDISCVSQESDVPRTALLNLPSFFLTLVLSLIFFSPEELPA